MAILKMELYFQLLNYNKLKIQIKYSKFDKKKKIINL